MTVNVTLLPLGDLCHVVGGGTPPKDRPEYYNGDIPWATVRDMRSEIIEETEFKITHAAVVASATKVIPAGNVIIATRVGLGKVCLIEQPTAINQDLRGVIPRDPQQLTVKYLFWWLKSVASLIEKEGTGATVQGVKLPFVKSLGLPLRSLAEQHRIVAILDEAFEAIATAKANVEKNLRNARELFESRREAALSVKSSAWDEAPLRDLCEVRHGYAFEGEFFAATGKYVLLTPGNFFEHGGYRDRGEKQKYFVGSIPRPYVLPQGSLLVAMTEQAAGLLGSPLLVPEADRFLHNQRLGLIVSKPGVAWANDFFCHVFNLKRVRAEIHASASGVKVRHTSPSKIGDVRVAFPRTVEDQARVASELLEVAAECDQVAAIYTQKLTALDELKKALLHQAFTGLLMPSRQTRIVQQRALQTATPEFTANVIAFAHAQHERQRRGKTFGHVKAQKVLHLVEAIAKIDLGRDPMKDAAGPNDFPHMLKAEEWAKVNNFFEMVKRGEGYEFKKLSEFDAHLASARKMLHPYLPELESVTDLLVRMDSEEAGIFATVLAAWNNLLIDGETVANDAIVFASREGWHPDKLQIEEHKFRSAIELIRQKGLVPDGTTKYVGGQKSLL